MIHRFKRADSPNRAAVPNGAVLNRLVSMVEWICKLQVGGGLRMESGPSGPIIIGAPGSANDLFKVRIEKTTGSPGTDSTAATFRYTVRPFTYTGSLASGEEDPILGTNIDVKDPRPVGRMIAQEGDTGVGWAFYEINGALWLWDAGEKEDTVFCSQLQGEASGSGS